MSKAGASYLYEALRECSGLILLLAIFLAPVAHGEQATSTSFSARETYIGTLGGESTSTSFGALQAGGPMFTGTATSSSFQVEAGPLAFDSFAMESQNWRWYNDETSETPSIALAAENTAPSNLSDGDVVKLRITLKEVNGLGAEGVKFKLQFSETSDFSTGAIDLAEAASCTTASEWCYADGVDLDNATITTKLLSDADPCVSSAGDGCGTHNESGASTSSRAQIANAATEYEFTVKDLGAHAGATYFFRAYDVLNDVPVVSAASSSYPSLVTSGATLTFTITGIGSGIITEGVSTTVTSTASSVPFGSLLFGADRRAAQRLTVTTNALHGYQIHLFEDQAFVNEANYEIPPVVATNETPAGWMTACAASLSGCLGYHAGDDVLAGNSTRFAADDSFARLETSTKEVAWSSGPVTARATDIVFRALARPNQPSGSYENAVSYIVTATY
jgi:hypothetical protein